MEFVNFDLQIVVGTAQQHELHYLYIFAYSQFTVAVEYVAENVVFSLSSRIPIVEAALPLLPEGAPGPAKGTECNHKITLLAESASCMAWVCEYRLART